MRDYLNAVGRSIPAILQLGDNVKPKGKDGRRFAGYFEDKNWTKKFRML